MNPLRMIQPFDLSHYQLPSTSNTELSSPVQVQISHDRASLVEDDRQSSTFSLSPPQTMQNSHSAPPTAAPYQPSFAFNLNDQRQNEFKLTMETQQPQPQVWPGKAFNTQTYETPYQSLRSVSSYSQHVHSHSTPLVYPTSYQPFSNSYVSQSSTPFQYSDSHSHSQSSSLPVPLPTQLKEYSGQSLPLPLQRGQSTDYTLPEGQWESNAPYPQPVHQSPDENVQVKSSKKNEKTIKCRKHICPVCDKRFNRPSSLNTHMSVHTGAKPYICTRPDCQRRFSVSSNLRRHERTHDSRAGKERQFNLAIQSSRSLQFQNQPHPQLQSQPLFTQPDQNGGPFMYNYYQPFPSSGYMTSDQLPPPPLEYATSASSSGSIGSTVDYGGISGLAQYQIVNRDKGFGVADMPRKVLAGWDAVNEEMDTKAGLLLT
ncbi:uncharacterized protein IL334_006286 [Kwoniella shivajii]|uniref:C2H2-type domain-containing protein n=1 Tax=Kwoniella shivajii TaxID=564305 RepID=A0ABZ1D6S0_9TREE|nr:hypothetical protein IL334_006286 [Kwoniella shivajii]